jgi:hypothetical protein
MSVGDVDITHCSTFVGLCKSNERRDGEIYIYRHRVIGEHKVMMAGLFVAIILKRVGRGSCQEQKDMLYNSDPCLPSGNLRLTASYRFIK